MSAETPIMVGAADHLICKGASQLYPNDRYLGERKIRYFGLQHVRSFVLNRKCHCQTSPLPVDNRCMFGREKPACVWGVGRNSYLTVYGPLKVNHYLNLQIQCNSSKRPPIRQNHTWTRTDCPETILISVPYVYYLPPMNGLYNLAIFTTILGGFLKGVGYIFKVSIHLHSHPFGQQLFLPIPRTHACSVRLFVLVFSLERERHSQTPQGTAYL